MSWKEQLTCLKLAAAEGRVNAYQIAKRLAKVFADPKFIEDCQRQRKNPDFVLTPYCDHLSLRFADLIALYKKFPLQKDWKGNLITDMMSKLAKETKDPRTRILKGTNLPNGQPSKKKNAREEELLKLRRENDQLKAENLQLKEQLRKFTELAKAVA